MAIELTKQETNDKSIIHENISKAFDYLVTSRPTAVNMRNAAQEFKVSPYIYLYIKFTGNRIP